MNGMNFESKRQELASRLVDREIYYCVSSLVSTLSNLAQNCSPSVLRSECLDWEEDILPLLESINYEEAVRAWVMDSSGTDVQSLEDAVEMGGYWENVVDASGYTTYLSEFIPTPEQEEAFDLQDWLDADSERDEKFRELVFAQLESTSDMEELCCEFQVDTDDFREDVYEHWIVSGWLAARLRERGEVTGDLCGVTIWGRCTTGQSICLDRVIQNIAIELWQEEWDEFVKSQESTTC
jgi:hypothetical protein